MVWLFEAKNVSKIGSEIALIMAGQQKRCLTGLKHKKIFECP